MLPVKEVIYDLFIMQYMYSPNTACTCISWKNFLFFKCTSAIFSQSTLKNNALRRKYTYNSSCIVKNAFLKTVGFFKFIVWPNLQRQSIVTALWNVYWLILGDCLMNCKSVCKFVLDRPDNRMLLLVLVHTP